MKLSLYLPSVRAVGLALTVSLASVLCGSSNANAQNTAASATEPPEYRNTVREALSEYHAKNFPEARALFAEAHAQFPNARTLRGLGMTAFELRSYHESIAYLTEALASQVKPLDGSLRTETERLLARAERFVGKLSLTVVPPDAHVLLDGSPMARVDGAPLVLEVGEHTLEFQADGYHTESRSLYVKGRETETWNVVLNAIPQPAPVVSVPPPAEVARRAEEPTGPRFVDVSTPQNTEKRPLYKNPWLWTGVASAVVIGAVVGVLLATRKTEVGKVQVGDNTPPGGKFSALEGRP